MLDRRPISRLFLAGTPLLLLTAALASCGGGSTPTSPTTGGGGGGGNIPPNTILVSNNSFSPSQLTVAVGTTVTWSWANGAFDHNVVPDNGSVPATSGSPMNGPHTYTYTFNTPGTFRFYCQVHGGPGGEGMAGSVVVQ
jgi:plastocyanin